MSDFNSSLPVRTENDGDVVVKVGDGTTPSQQLKVEADGSINVNSTISATDLDIRDLVFATDKVDVSGSEVSLDAATLAALENVTVSATDLDIRDLAFATDSVDVSGSEVSLDATTLAALESITVQNGAGASAVNIQDGGNSITVDAVDLDIRDLAFATDSVDVSGSEVSLDAATLAALESITVQNGAGAAAVNIQDGGNSLTVDAVDLDIRDLTHVSDSIKVGDGTDLLAVNTDGSINVVIQEDVGLEVVNYNTAAAVAAGATSNHDLVFASASKLYQIHASASSKLKIEVQVETGAATGVFNTRLVAFNSTATPNIVLTLSKYAAIPLGARVRVIRTNKDNQAQDVYSTIIAILG
jgi:fructose-specific phosphotransferase system component IIB